MNHEYIKLNECIICLESNDTDNSMCKLNTFNKQYDCDSYIHKQCLLKWYNYNKSCPICKTTINNDILPNDNSINEEDPEQTITQIYSFRDCMNTILVKCTCYIVIIILIAVSCNQDLFKFQTDN